MATDIIIDSLPSVTVGSLPALPTGSNTIGAISNSTFAVTQATGSNLHANIDALPATNIGLTALASGAYTTSQSTLDIANPLGRFLHVILNVTVAGTGSITLTIYGKDPTSGTYYPLLTGAPVTTNGTTVYRVGPALTPSANLTANDMLPSVFKISTTANNANAMTYSIGYNIGGN